MEKQKTFLTSDTHYSHINICRGVSKWNSENSSNPSNTRDFDTLEEMNYAIVNAINSRVGENDVLYHLGDWSFGGWKNIWEFRKRINCKNIHLVLGNHDDHIRKNKFFPHLMKDSLGVICEIENPIDYIKDENSEFAVRAKDFFTSVNERLFLPLKEYKTGLDLMHHPLEDWHNANQGWIHVHGHCHGSLPRTDFKREDAGLDAQGFNVVSLEEVMEIMSQRISKNHH